LYAQNRRAPSTAQPYTAPLFESPPKAIAAGMDTVRESDDPSESPMAKDTLLQSKKMLSELKKSRRKAKLSSCSKREFDLTSMDDVSGFHTDAIPEYEQNTIRRSSIMPRFNDENEIKMNSSESYEIPNENFDFQSPLKQRMFNY